MIKLKCDILILPQSGKQDKPVQVSEYEYYY